MFNLEKCDTFLVTREQAVKINTMKHLPGERDEGQAHMRYLDGLLTAGKFRTVDWSIVRFEDTGEVMRCDGKHSSGLLGKCSADRYPAGILGTIKHWRADSLKIDGADLFEYFNNPRLSRSTTDKMNFFKAEHKALLDVPSSFLVWMGNGYHYYLKASMTSKNGRQPIMVKDPRERGSYLPAVRPFALWLYPWEREWQELKEEGSAHTANRKMLNRWVFAKAEIVAAIFQGWKTDPEIATNFWGHFIRDDHPRQDDNSRELSRILNKWKDGKEKIEAGRWYQQAVRAWVAEWKKRSKGGDSEGWVKKK